MFDDLPIDNYPVPYGSERAERVRRQPGTDLELHGDVVLGRLPATSVAQRAVELSRPAVRPQYSTHVHQQPPVDDLLYSRRTVVTGVVMVGAMLAIVMAATVIAVMQVLAS